MLCMCTSWLPLWATSVLSTGDHPEPLWKIPQIQPLKDGRGLPVGVISSLDRYHCHSGWLFEMVLEGGCVWRKHPPRLTWKVVNMLEPALKLQGASGDAGVQQGVKNFPSFCFPCSFWQNLTFLFCNPVAQFLPNRKVMSKHLVNSPTLPFYTIIPFTGQYILLPYGKKNIESTQ